MRVDQSINSSRQPLFRLRTWFGLSVASPAGAGSESSRSLIPQRRKRSLEGEDEEEHPVRKSPGGVSVASGGADVPPPQPAPVPRPSRPRLCLRTKGPWPAHEHDGENCCRESDVQADPGGTRVLIEEDVDDTLGSTLLGPCGDMVCNSGKIDLPICFLFLGA